MLKDSVDREINAVDSENNNNLQSEHMRMQQLIQSIAHKEHSLNRFATGNFETLKKDDIRDQLIVFH